MISETLIFVWMVGSILGIVPAEAGRLPHPIPEGQIYRDLQVTIKDQSVHLKVIARASEKTWLLWIKRTNKKILFHNQKVIDQKTSPKSSQVENKKKSVDGSGKTTIPKNKITQTDIGKKVSPPNWIPDDMESTVKWLQEKKNLRFLLETTALQTKINYLGKDYSLKGKAVRHSGRHHWAVEMEFELDLEKAAPAKQARLLPKFRFQTPPTLPKLVLPEAESKINLTTKKEPSSAARPSSNVQSKKLESAANSANKLPFGQSLNARQEPQSKKQASRSPTFDPNFQLNQYSFSDFGGLIRRGIRVRGDAELERTDHAVLFIRSPFELKKPSSDADAIWAIISLEN